MFGALKRGPIQTITFFSYQEYFLFILFIPVRKIYILVLLVDNLWITTELKKYVTLNPSLGRKKKVMLYSNVIFSPHPLPYRYTPILFITMYVWILSV